MGNLLRRLLYLIRLRRHSADLSEELETHQRMIQEEEIAFGLSAEDAHAAARRRLGNATLAREDARGIWLAAWISGLVQDLRYGARSLRAHPGFTMFALLALVLGTGLNTALFTFYNAVAFRPWPVRDPSRVVAMTTFFPPNRRSGGFSVAEYRYLRDHSRTLAGAILERGDDVDLDAAGGPPLRAHFVSGNYFDVLGVSMARGRSFTPAEDREAITVLSDATWKNRYGSDPGMIGRQIRVDGVPFTVIGVASADFTGTSQEPYALWIPLSALALARPGDPTAQALLNDPHWCCSRMAGRLGPGVRREQAQAELTTLAAQFTAQLREPPHEVALTGTAILSQVSSNNNDKGNKFLRVIPLLLGAVGAVLLLACANVSNLLLARAAARQREIAVRVAIGAGRARIIRQLLTESFLLAALAGALSLGLVTLVVSNIETPGAMRLTPDRTVLAYTFGLAILSAAAFGLAPALRGTRISVSDAMKLQSSHASPRFPLRSVLLGFQVAVSAALLVAGGLLARSLYQAHFIDLGFQTAGLSAVTVDLTVNSYSQDGTRVFFDDLLSQVQQVAGSRPVGAAITPPLGNSRWMTGLHLPDQPVAREDIVLDQWVNAGYFETLGISILAGRNFVPDDRAGGNILINEAMARHYWPGQSAVGQTILQGHDRRQVIGVVRDSQIYGLGPVDPTFFEPYSASPRAGRRSVLIVPADLAPAVSEIARRAEPRALTSIASLSNQVDAALQPARMGAAIAAGLGLLALLLATVGVYGVISYSVEQRRREIAVRTALGAGRAEILRLIAGSNARTILLGLGAGLGLSLAVSKALESFLYGVSRVDPLTYGGVLALLFAAGVAASVIPARRAARLDCLSELRHD